MKPETHRCADYCPLYGRAHRYSDWDMWGNDKSHPQCDCGYIDTTRIITNENRETRQSAK